MGTGTGAYPGAGARAGAYPGAGASTGAYPGAGAGAGAYSGAGTGAAPGGAGSAAATAPTTPGAEAGAAAGAAAPAAAPTDEGAFAALGSDVGGEEQAFFTPNMIGDLSPYYAQPGVAPINPPGPRGLALAYPTLRNFKASENQSPMPQDRFFFDFNYWNNVNSAVNTANRSPINHLKAYTYMWGFEKTFDGGNGSIGMRLPLDSLTARSNVAGISAPTSSALGNIDIFAKYILKRNVQTGSLITAGFQITPPTATRRFAGAPYIAALNTTYFQPFIAYIWRRDRFYIQGFSGFNFPADNADVTLMYNDVGMGYFVYRNFNRGARLTAVAPTFEVHVDTPFNHRNAFNRFDLAASPYVCNLTYGLNMMFGNRTLLTAALVTPVTGPRPFDAEFAFLLNVFYGRTARRPMTVIPPVVQ